MRVPIDPTQWGMVAIQKLVSAFPSLEPYIQFAHLAHQDENGNGLGLIPMQDGTAFVPFIIVDFALKPIDTLISMADGEERFMNLSESNVMMAIGGLGLGQPVDKLPPGVSQDQRLNMFPPYGMGGALNMGRRGRPDVSSAVVKSSSNSPEPHPENVERFLKMAYEHDRDLGKALSRVYSTGPIKLAEQNSLMLEPRRDDVALYVNGEKTASLSLREANLLLHELGAEERLPELMDGKWTVLGGMSKTASAFTPVSAGKIPVKTPGEMNRPTSPFIKHEGWYQIGGERVRIFRTVYLDGRPCGVLLGVARHGYLFDRDMVGRPVSPPNTEILQSFLQASKLKPGELAFAVNDVTGEATIPFKVLAGAGHENRVVLSVAPILGTEPVIHLSFGANKTPMAIDRDEIAFPRQGWTIYRLDARRMDADVLHSEVSRPVHVRIFKGGGVFSVKEDIHAPFHGLNRGQLAHMLMNRYGFNPDAAIDLVRNAEQYLETEFLATPCEEPENMSPAFHPEAADLSLRILRLVKLAAGESGPNREPMDPGESGMGPPGAMMPTPSSGAAIMPEIPGLTEIAEQLASYAMGAFSPDELAEMFSKLIDDLAEVQNIAGKLLMLVRLGAVQFITEQETKRLFEEADRFRSSLLNANMLLKGIGMAV